MFLEEREKASRSDITPHHCCKSHKGRKSSKADMDGSSNSVKKGQNGALPTSVQKEEGSFWPKMMGE